MSVTGYRDGIVYTVEGNTSSPAIFSGGGTVARKSYPITNSYIVYICCPDYERTGQKVKSGVATRTLAQKKEAVEQAVNLLESGDIRGYDCVGCDAEGVVTLGSGQWHGEQARSLVTRIQNADPSAFAALDTAGLAGLLAADWTGISLNQAQTDCLRGILGSEAGVRIQQECLRQQMAEGQALAETLGVTEPEAKLACGALYCLGGAVAVRRAVGNRGAELNSKAICGAMDTMGYAGNVILDALS